MRSQRYSTALMLLPAMLVLVPLFRSSLLYGLMQSLGWQPLIRRTEISLAAYWQILFDPDYAPKFWQIVGFYLWISFISTALSAVLAVGPAYEDSACTLGAGPVWVFLEITIPVIFPRLVVAGLFAFLISFRQYLLTMLIGGSREVSLPVLLFSSIPGGDNPAIAALSLVFVPSSVFILVFTSRYLSGRSAAMQGLGRKSHACR